MTASTLKRICTRALPSSSLAPKQFILTRGFA